jgi:hypothetical protein
VWESGINPSLKNSLPFPTGKGIKGMRIRYNKFPNMQAGWGNPFFPMIYVPKI